MDTIEAPPVATTEAAPAAPATSAPVSESAPSRPATALEAFAQVTAEDTPTPETAATGQGDPGAPKEKGEPPKEKWEQILANARTKAETEAMTKWREQYGWAETVDRAAIEQAQQLGKLYTTDRAGYVRQLLSEAVTDPELAPIVRSEAARILAGSRQPHAPSFEPDIPVYDAQGQLVNQTFSAEKQRELITHIVTEALGKEVGPIKQDLDARQAAQKKVDDQIAFDKTIKDIWDDSSDLPHFTEHAAEIGKVYAALKTDGTPESHARALRQAWKRVVGPKLDQIAQTKALDSFKTKAAAQTVDGSGRAASTPKRPTNPAELAAYMRQIST